MNPSKKPLDVLPVQSLQLQRMLTFAGFLALGFCFVIGKLIYLQVFQHKELLSKAQQKTHRTYLQETERGKILEFYLFLFLAGKYDASFAALSKAIPCAERPADKSICQSRNRNQAPRIQRMSTSAGAVVTAQATHRGAFWRDSW